MSRSPALIIRPAEPGEIPAALKLLLQHESSFNANPIATWERLLQDWRQGMWPDHAIMVACEQHQIRGAMFAQAMPGAVGMIWPPQTDEGPNADAIAVALLQHGIQQLHRFNLSWLQAILPMHDLKSAALLLRQGFQFLTNLSYMLHTLHRVEKPTAQGQELRWISYTPEQQPLLAATLQLTYQDSLDCPELNGLRSMADVLEGHRDTKVWQPHWWRFVLLKDTPIAVVIHAINKELPRPAWELLYIGLVPQARGQGWGQTILQQFLNEAKQEGAEHVLLAVDNRNAPALQLYERLGFEAWDQRAIYLKIYAKNRTT